MRRRAWVIQTEHRPFLAGGVSDDEFLRLDDPTDRPALRHQEAGHCKGEHNRDDPPHSAVLTLQPLHAQREVLQIRCLICWLPHQVTPDRC